MKTAKEWLLEQLKGFENQEDYKDENINAIADFMEHYAKYYHEQQVKSVDLADVGGSLPKVKIERYRLRDVDEEKYLSEMERLGFEFITFDTKIEDASDRFRYYYFRHKQ